MCHVFPRSSGCTMAKKPVALCTLQKLRLLLFVIAIPTGRVREFRDVIVGSHFRPWSVLLTSSARYSISKVVEVCVCCFGTPSAVVGPPSPTKKRLVSQMGP